MTNPLVGRTLADRYELTKFVGSGTVTSTYWARDLHLHRDVIVKVLGSQYARDPAVARSFQRHAHAAAALTAHPNIASVYVVSQHEGLPFLVMEAVDGRTLTDALDADPPFDADRACHVAAEVASALEFAHRHGLVHGGLNPDNVLLARDGSVKVTDVGMDVLSGTAGSPGSRPAAARYLSPEQLQGKKATPASDIYALGAILFEMLSGKHLSDPDVAAPHGGKRPPKGGYPPSAFRSGVPVELDATVRRALARNPKKRFATVAAFREALQGRAGHHLGRVQPVDSRPPNTHHAIIVTAAIALLLALWGVGALAAYSKLFTHSASPPVPTRTATAKSAPVTRPTQPPPPTPRPTAPRPRPTPLPVIARGMGLAFIYVMPAYVQPGGMMALRYTVTNSSGHLVPVELAATIIRSRSGLAFSDRTHSVTVRALRGRHEYIRQFEVPITAPRGIYNLLVSINTPNMGHSYAHIRLRRLVAVGAGSSG